MPACCGNWRQFCHHNPAPSERHIVVPAAKAICVTWFPRDHEGYDTGAIYPAWVFDKLARPDSVSQQLAKTRLASDLATLHQEAGSSLFQRLPLEIFEQITLCLDELSMTILAIACPDLLARVNFRIENDFKSDCSQWAEQPLACLGDHPTSLPPQFEHDPSINEGLKPKSTNPQNYYYLTETENLSKAFKRKALQEYKGVRKSVYLCQGGVEKPDCDEASTLQRWVSAVEKLKRVLSRSHLNASQMVAIRLLDRIAHGDIFYGLGDDTESRNSPGRGSHSSECEPTIWYLRNLDRKEYVRVVRHFGYMDTVFDVMGNSVSVAPCHLAWISREPDCQLSSMLPHSHWVIDAPKLPLNKRVTLFNKLMKTSLQRLQLYPQEYCRRKYQYVYSGSDQVPDLPKMTLEQFMAIQAAWHNYNPRSLYGNFGRISETKWSGSSYDMCSQRSHDAEVDMKASLEQWQDVTEKGYENVLSFRY